MPRVHADLPEKLAREVDEIARQFDQSLSEIVERAVAQFARGVAEARAAANARRAYTVGEPDWGTVKRTLQEAACPFADCPFSGDCPVEVCPL